MGEIVDQSIKIANWMAVMIAVAREALSTCMKDHLISNGES
jgi:hypothetical protein